MSQSNRSLVGRIGAFLVAPAETTSIIEPINLSVEHARQEWLTARAFFETVSDPDLVDQAIYLLEAAERKYMYLLRKARQELTAVGASEPPTR